jgi:hypothetical protein
MFDPNYIITTPEVVAQKTIPNVDWYGVAMQPMIQTLRVPATAPFKKEKGGILVSKNPI